MGNPNSSGYVTPGGSRVLLYLTDIRSSQQNDSVKTVIALAKEQLKNLPFRTKTIPPSFCGKYPVALVEIEGKRINKARIIKMKCRSWRCPSCQKDKALQVKYLIRDVARINHLDYFLTLTLSPAKIPDEYVGDTHRYITKLFNHLMTTVKRKKFKYYNSRKKKYYSFDLKKSGTELKYVWVMEYQENGNAHLHILLNKFLPVTVIRKVWTHIGGGHSMWIEKVKSLDAASAYISDYVVKGINNKKPNFKFFQKRYAISQSSQRPPSIYKSFNSLTVDEQKVYLTQDQQNTVYNALENPDSEENIEL